MTFQTSLLKGHASVVTGVTLGVDGGLWLKTDRIVASLAETPERGQ